MSNEHESVVGTDHEAPASGRIPIGDLVTVYKRGKRGTYVADFWHAGQHKRRSLKTASLPHARRKALQLEAELAGGNYAAPPKPIDINAVVEEYLAVKKGEGLAQKSLTKYREWLESFQAFAADAGVANLRQVTPALFEKYRAFRRPSQADKSLYTGLVIVKSFFKWCAGPGQQLTLSPVAGCKVVKPYAAPKTVPTRKQVQAIVDAAAGAARAQYALLAYSGLRAGELQMLRPRDVDLVRGWVHVIGREGWVPKTRQARKVPIHPHLMRYLKEYAAALPKTPRPYFFCEPPSRTFPLGDRPVDLRDLNKDFQKLAKSLGCRVGRKDDGLVIHSLRHFFETRCVDSRVPQFLVDAWMGHAGHASMGRVYYGHSDGKSKRFMKRVRFVKRVKAATEPQATKQTNEGSES